MTTPNNYGATRKDVTDLPAEAGKPVLQSSEGDLVNQEASEARWGRENTGGVGLSVMAFGAIILGVLALFIILGIFVL